MDEKDLQNLHIDGTDYATTLPPKYHRRKGWKARDDRQVRAFIPGVIVRVSAKAGGKVRRGDELLVLEAMKMQNPVLALRDGVVRAVAVQPGQIVPKGALLVEFE